MNDFEILVEKILSGKSEYVPLRTVVEKEILHHEILRVLSEEDFLQELTFMGGTCLRDCYGSGRLSEDLDFTGGFDFSKDQISELGSSIKSAILKKYGFAVEVTEPKRETGNVDTWKIKVVTKAERPDFPSQKINIDICRLPSRDRKVQFVRNCYGIDLGTSGMPVFVESLKEIMCDKLVAFARRPNRVKNRDLWDIFWLSNKNVPVDKKLLTQKLDDRKIPPDDFESLYNKRIEEIKPLQQDFLDEMKRFLVPGAFSKSFVSSLWWAALVNLMEGLLM